MCIIPASYLAGGDRRIEVRLAWAKESPSEKQTKNKRTEDWEVWLWW
jgi:hypothetical protein